MSFLRRSSRQSRRNNDITQEPEEGWLHDDDALMLGEGFFYSYPVEFLGSVEIEFSMNDVPLPKRTEIVRYCMNRLLVETKRLKKAGKPPKGYEDYCHGATTIGEVEVSFGIAADGMVVVLNTGSNLGDEQPPLLFYHSMPMISIATGGDKESYDLCSYVAKDGTGKRCCYIFDCGEQSDEVLATLGQSFNLAQEVAMKKRQRPDTNQIKKEYLSMDPEESNGGYGDPSQALAAVPEYDTAEPAAVQSQPEYDVAVQKQTDDAQATYDNPSDLTNPRIVTSPAYDVGTAANSQQQAEAIYDVAESKDKIVRNLNKRTSQRRSVRQSMKKPVKAKRKSMKKKAPEPEPTKEDVALQSAEQEDLSRPSWICISEAAKDQTSSSDLGSLLQQFKSQATVEESDEEDEDSDSDDE